MSSRDDLVLRPSIGGDLAATASRRAGDAGKMDRAGGLIARVRERSMLRRSLATSVRAAAARGAVSVARFGVRGAASAAARGVASAPGLILAALVVGGITAIRLGTGQPLEGLGSEINRIVLGDADDEARARMATREQLTGDSQIARIVGQEGQVNQQIRRVFDDLYGLNRRNEIGASLLREAFPVNSALDLMILAAAEALRAAFNGSGGPAAMDKLRDRYQASRPPVNAKGGR